MNFYLQFSIFFCFFAQENCRILGVKYSEINSLQFYRCVWWNTNTQILRACLIRWSLFDIHFSHNDQLPNLLSFHLFTFLTVHFLKVKVLVAQLCLTLLWPCGPTRLLCPWNSPGKNTGVGCHFLLQGIFLTQGLNLGLLHFRQILCHQGSPPLLKTQYKC